jgi:histidinol-phosphate phosphatase family protein
MNKAVFLDRDGVINELIYYPEHGIVDSPFTPEQFKLFPWAVKSIKKLSGESYQIIIVSNQPGIAKGYLSKDGFERIREKMNLELEAQGALIDGEYYCFHHPEAKVKRLKANCTCRKPGSRGFKYRFVSVLDDRRWPYRCYGWQACRMQDDTFRKNEM